MRTIIQVLALCLAATALPTLAVAPPKGQLQPHVPGQLIVRFRADLRADQREAQLLRLGARETGTIAHGRQQLLDLGSGADLRSAIARLHASGTVDYAHPNYYRRKLAPCISVTPPRLCPNDPELGLQYHLHNTDVVGGFDSDADLDMPQAWSMLTGAPDVRLAIIDDGFDLDHPDLDANLSNGVRCDQTLGCGATAAAVATNEDHGTMVAGSAAAVGNNGLMGTGVIMSGDVYPIRMPNYTSAEVVLGVDHAIAMGARIINMSFGGPGFTQSEVDAIERARAAGILVVAAAGNEDSNTDKAVASYPANYPLDNILAVGASDASDNMAGFSTWGSFSVELAAPGSNIVTTMRDGTTDAVDGTSFSSPITAAAAALVGQALTNDGNTTWDHLDLKAYLLAGADNASDTGLLDLRGRVAAGRLNVHRSLQLVDGGLSGAVLVVKGLAFDDDATILLGNDEDGMPDPSETFDLVVTLQNVWQADSNIAATLSTTDIDATVVDGDDTVAAIAQHGVATATFRVALGAFSGNEQIRFRLDLDPATGPTQTRYFFLEVGSLQNGAELMQGFQRTNWDEFHAWHANVPVGATNVVFETHSNGGIDIDLIARKSNPPAYFAVLATSISTGGGTGEACEVSDPCIISGAADGEETIGDPAGDPGTDITGVESGTWHLVVVNFDQLQHVYRVKASWDAAGAGTIRFASAASTVPETIGQTTLQVVRSGGVGPVSVDWTVGGGPAGASDFVADGGTLSWANGDTSPRTITVGIKTDNVAEPAEDFYVGLSNPVGGADLGRHRVHTITITDSPPGGGGGGGGGGASDALLLAGLAALLAARRRRARC